MPSLFSKLTDLDFLNRVKPITLQRYGAALQPFTSWAMEEGLDPISAEDWDDALLDYRGLHVATMTKSKFITLVASLEFYLPQVKGNFVGVTRLFRDGLAARRSDTRSQSRNERRRCWQYTWQSGVPHEWDLASCYKYAQGFVQESY